MTAILINQLKFYPQQYRIYQGKNKIDLQPKCAELLNFLAERHGQVISKETLLQTIWQDRVVGEDVLTSCIRKIRKQLNDDAKSPQFIETINKKGYRLIATVATPKTKQWWGKLFTTSMAVIFLLGVMSFGFTHSEITIHRFSTTDTIEEREQKLRAMAGFIEQNPNETRSLTISIPSATTNNHSDES